MAYVAASKRIHLNRNPSSPLSLKSLTFCSSAPSKPANPDANGEPSVSANPMTEAAFRPEVMELIAGLVLCLWVALTVPGKFLSILPHSDENRVVTLPANLDFVMFNHRGKAFPVDVDVKLK